MSERFAVVIDGITDPTLIDEITRTILDAFHRMALPGAWRVTVKPSPVRGRWDFAVYGLDARHSLSIAAPPTLLSNLIPQRLRESLNRSLLLRNGVDPDSMQGVAHSLGLAGTASASSSVLTARTS